MSVDFLTDHLTAVSAILIGVVFGIIPLVWFYKRIWKPAGAEVDMFERGFRGEARILEIHGTGAMADHSPMMGLRLEVRHPDGSVYRAQIDEVIVPVVLLSRLKPGAVVPVKIAREDKNLVSLD